MVERGKSDTTGSRPKTDLPQKGNSSLADSCNKAPPILKKGIMNTEKKKSYPECESPLNAVGPCPISHLPSPRSNHPAKPCLAEPTLSTQSWNLMNPLRALLRFSLAAVLLVTTLTFTGCIEWEHQTVSYRYDRKTDTLLIFQDFQGIHGANNQDKLIDKEVTQIKSVINGERTFFFANWVFEINMKQLRDQLADLKDESGDTVDEDVALRKTISALELFLKNCSIENGDFYLNKQKDLSATQRITIRNVSKILPLVNEALKAVFKAEASKSLEDMDAQAAWDLVRKADWTFLEFKGNQIIFKFPDPKSAEESEKKPSKFDEEELADWKRAGVELTYKDDVRHGQIGQVKDKVTRMSYKPVGFDGSYSDNLLKHLQGTTKILGSLDAEKAAQSFLQAN